MHYLWAQTIGWQRPGVGWEPGEGGTSVILVISIIKIKKKKNAKILLTTIGFKMFQKTS